MIKDLTPELVTKYFLYGKDIDPLKFNLKDERLIRDNNAIVRIDVDTSDFMGEPGRFAIGSQFELISRLLNPEFHSPGEHSLSCQYTRILTFKHEFHTES